jgi:fused signal recognition particle receptor
MELNIGNLILVASSILVVTFAIIWLRKKAKPPKKTPQVAITTTPLKDGLSKTRLGIWDKIASLLSNNSEDVQWEAIEEVLYSADLSVAMSQEILELLKKAKKTPEFKWQIFLKNYFLERLSPLYEKQQAQLSFLESPLPAIGVPHILMITGVNGVGKTTTIGKLAHFLSDKKNRKIVLAAGDTFRAAAKEQLQVWAERSKAEIVAGKEGGDPSAVAFDAMKMALEKKSDLLIFDTAGRLQNKTHLMDE